MGVCHFVFGRRAVNSNQTHYQQIKTRRSAYGIMLKLHNNIIVIRK